MRRSRRNPLTQQQVFRPAYGFDGRCSVHKVEAEYVRFNEKSVRKEEVKR